MGKRNFEKITNKDNVWNNSCDISELYNVTNKKEYIQVNISFMKLFYRICYLNWIKIKNSK